MRSAAPLVLALALCVACGRDAAPPGAEAAPSAAGRAGSDGQVTVSGDDAIAASLTWQPPATDVQMDTLDAARARADAALAEGALYADGESAIPLYLGVLALAPGDAKAQAGLQRAVERLLEQGASALLASSDDLQARREAHRIASVARSARPSDPAVARYLAAVDEADRLWELNRHAEVELRAGRLGEAGGGALASAREVLKAQPGQPRAMQMVAAIESAMIRRAEDAAGNDAFDDAQRWLERAGKVREDTGTVDDARERVARIRQERIGRLRDLAITALPGVDGIEKARAELGRMIAIAEPGNAVVAELRERIDLAVHYGLFRPGQ
ncbi:MAG TPA: formylglycine-generating enzyme family protein, partial [Luteimonas sp.]|nr:formylglycine-generating enzyme family protein [Luteimonas sp.]